MQRTKIVATLGPASWSEETIKRLILEGVRIFRLNFSHADYEKYKEIVDTLRKFETQTRPITILGDLQGPVIRLGNFNSFRVNPGDDVVFVNAKETAESKKVPVPYAPFFEIAKEGDEVLVEGGALTFRVTKVGAGEAVCQAVVEGEVKPRKTVTIRGKDVPLPTITEKDMKDIEFAVKTGFDVIALSFVRKPQDIQQLRDTLFDLGAEDVKIMAKIETKSAVESLESILQLSDAVLVARGDLANYYELEEIYRLQNFIIREARRQGKPSVVATQLLESMINNPIPTRSEVVDVITAVRMGADALMLAGETAAGKYPVESVVWLKKIITEAEKLPPEPLEITSDKADLYESIAEGVVLLSKIINAKIIAFSEKGNTARRLSKFRPQKPVILITNDLKTARYTNLMSGATPLYYPEIQKTDPEIFQKMLAKALENSLVNVGELVVFTSGRRRGSTDLVSVERVKTSE
ncbi:MAG: pyruvate kinase [Thermofilum sp.]|uniref:Pyruvate kinase n=1 Tax=Thermofilum adornatum TaxID=1365176 RepID=S5ZD35_9CREN|nr:pyruvate kinase [Thermofilum adornatum]AGT34913.1 hypothetical protein N186_02660 [Thermofilum adornatum]